MPRYYLKPRRLIRWRRNGTYEFFIRESFFFPLIFFQRLLKLPYARTLISDESDVARVLARKYERNFSTGRSRVLVLGSAWSNSDIFAQALRRSLSPRLQSSIAHVLLLFRIYVQNCSAPPSVVHAIYLSLKIQNSEKKVKQKCQFLLLI